jgi:hypothetical protein
MGQHRRKQPPPHRQFDVRIERVRTLGKVTDAPEPFEGPQVPFTDQPKTRGEKNDGNKQTKERPQEGNAYVPNG